jgi:hypothetical protein
VKLVCILVVSVGQGATAAAAGRSGVGCGSMRAVVSQCRGLGAEGWWAEGGEGGTVGGAAAAAVKVGQGA